MEQYAAARATTSGVIPKARRRAPRRYPAFLAARAPAAAARLRRGRPALGGPARLHHARSARAGRGRARAHQAPGAVRQGQALRRAGARGRGGGHRPQSGEVQALVGGRDVRFRGFNRALDAARPVGLAPQARHLPHGARPSPSRYTLVTPIDDGPFVWKSRGAPDWEPPNYDKKFHGMVQLRTALALSYNAATARLGTEIGIERVLANMKRLGIERELKPFAATLLGAVELSPARGGADVPDDRERGIPHAAARDPRSDHAGRPAAAALPARGGAGVPAEPTYLAHRRPAGRGARRHGPGAEKLPAAGDARRRQDRHHRRAARRLVRRLHRRPPRRGVGRLRRQPRREALRLRRRAADLGRPDGGARPEPLALAKPDRIEQRAGSTRRAGCAAISCPGAQELPFVQGSAPRERAPCASPVDAAVEAVGQSVEKAKSWFERLFGR